MIARLRGELVEVEEGRAVVDVGGVGYAVRIGSRHSSRTTVGDEVAFSISTQVREDSITLFGFRDPLERKAFDVLLGVSGIGPKLALSLIDELGLKKLSVAVAQEDERVLTAVSGVGRKTAQRVLLELKGKLSVEFIPNYPTLTPAEVNPQDDLALALARLGYKKSEIDRAFKGLEQAGMGESSLQERLSGSLTILSGGKLAP